MHIDSGAWIIVAISFFLAGIVHGVVGFGFSTVALAVLTVNIGLPAAMALLLAPSFVIHGWQAITGSPLRPPPPRLWLFLLATVPAIWLGVRLSFSLRMWVLLTVCGGVLAVYATIGMFGLRLVMSRRRAVWSAPLAGILTGVCTGLTGAFEASGAGYLQAVGLPRQPFMLAMALLGTTSTAGLAVALWEQRLLTTELGLVSIGAIAPAAMGIALGIRLRNKRAASRFRRLFFVVLLSLGLYVLVHAFYF